MTDILCDTSDFVYKQSRVLPYDIISSSLELDGGNHCDVQAFFSAIVLNSSRCMHQKLRTFCTSEHSLELKAKHLPAVSHRVVYYTTLCIQLNDKLAEINLSSG